VSKGLSNNPKIIHRIYFDNFSPFYDPFEHYLESWAREMPDYTVMKWNASNLDVNENRWTRLAAENKQPVFLSEYFRWKVLAEYGGLYLDADCEVLNGQILGRIVDDLYQADDYDVFFGVEDRATGHPTAQTVGAKKGAPLVQFMKGLYEGSLPELWMWREKRGLIGPQLMALYYLREGVNVADDGYFKDIDGPIVKGRAKVYPQAYFSPKYSLIGHQIDFKPEQTCVYHMFANSNLDFSKAKRYRAVREQALTFEEYMATLSERLKLPRVFDADWLRTNVGQHTEAGIEVDGERDGTATYGPYVALPAGRYHATLSTPILPTTGSGVLRVTSGSGAHTLARKSLTFPGRATQTISLPFDVPMGGAEELEVVLSVKGIDKLVISSLRIDDTAPAETLASPSADGSPLKILHRIYFGFDGKPDQFQRYLETWKTELPDFRIMHWNATNLPMDLNPYVQRLYAEKDHAFLTDYFRWYVLREYGGTYLDADVEIVDGKIYGQLIEELEASSQYDAFIGIDEKTGGWYTAHSMASKPHSEISEFMCNLYENFGSFVAWRKKGFYFWAPQLTALYFANIGHRVAGMGTTAHLEEPVIVGGVKIYPQEWFSPLAPTGDAAQPFKLNAYTSNTALAHHFACSWHDEGSIYLQHSQTQGGQANVLLKEIAATLPSSPQASPDIVTAPPAAAGKQKSRWKGREIRTAVGKMKDGVLATTGRKGFLAYGPYITLRPGSYRVTFDLDRIETPVESWIDVAADNGTRILSKRRQLSQIAGPSHKVSIDLTLQEKANNVEFRVFAGGKTRLALAGVSIADKPKPIIRRLVGRLLRSVQVRA
jgi:mannosyltransferase OCH1-like enzyme